MAAADTRKLVEHLRILTGHSENLLVSLYNYRCILDPDSFPVMDSVISDGSPKTATPKQEQPRLLHDPSLQNIVKAFLKKFPECPDMSKIAGYQALMTEGKTISEEIKPCYYLLIDTMEFTGTTISALLTCEKLSGLNCVHHFAITNMFFLLLTNFVRIQLLINDMGSSKKAVAAAYNFLYAYDNGSIEPSFHRLVTYINLYDKPYVQLQETFGGMSIFITSLLQSLSVEFTRYGLMTVEQLRKDGGLNATVNVKTAAVDDNKLRLLPMFNQYATYVVIVFLVCPGELIKQSLCAEMLKTVLSQNLCISAFRSEVLNPTTEFEDAIKGNSKLSKVKSIVTESFGMTFSRAAASHLDRREYLRFVLRQLVCLGDDRPFILSYKFPIVENALLMAREEILWYFSHLDRTISVKILKISNKAAQNQVPIDPSISELISLVLELREVVMKHQQVVRDFYANLFTTHYAPLMENIVTEIMRTNAPSDAVTQIFLNILDEITKATSRSSFDAVRLNFARLLVHFHSIDTTVAISTVPDFINVMNEIASRSRYIDILPEVVENAASLKFLYYYRPLLYEHVEDCIKSYPNQIRFLWAYPKLAVEFTRNAIPYYNREYDRIGVRTIQFVEEFYIISSRAISSCIHNLALIHVQHGAQLAPENAVMFVPDRRDKKQIKKATDRPKLRPGHESILRNSPFLNNLPSLRLCVTNGLYFMTKYESVNVHDIQFFPGQYLKDVMISRLKGFMMNEVYPDEQAVSPGRDLGDENPFTIKRPSEFLRQLTVYMSVLEGIDDVFPINLHDLMKDVFLEQIDLAQARKVGVDAPDAAVAKKEAKVKGKKMAFTGNVPNQTFLITYANWYVEYMREKGTAGTAILSPLKKSVIGSHSSSFKAQLYTDSSELVALCQLIGPGGVRYIDERLVQQIFLLAKDIKDVVSLNQEILSVIQKHWHIEAKLEENIRKLKQFDLLISSTINLGFIMQFRRNLFEALTYVLDNAVPFAMGCIRTAHDLYPANIYSIPEFQSLDTLANFSGLNHHVDTMLKFWVQGHCRNPNADHRLYVLFPCAYAVALRVLSTDSKNTYNTYLDAADNNSHTVSVAVSSLLTSLISITAPNDTEQMASLHREFLEVSATLLLRGGLKTDSAKTTLLLLSEFVQVSPFMNEDNLEEFIPYSLIRNTYSDYFRRETANRRINVRIEEEVA